MDEERRRKGLLGIIQGAADRWTKQRSRDEIVEQAVEDPEEPLAQRVVEPDACKHCQDLGDSEPVSPSSVAHEFHQYCKCHVAIVFNWAINAFERSKNRVAASRMARKELDRIKRDYPLAYEEWQRAVLGITSMKTAQSLYQHVPGTKQFKGLKGTASWFYLPSSGSPRDNVESVRKLINERAGTGYPGVRFDGHWDGNEHVYCAKIIGVDRRSLTETGSMKIHYVLISNRVHAVPKYDGTGQRIDLNNGHNA